LAHSKSAKKAARQTVKRTLRNKAVRTFYRDRIKACREAIASGDKAKAGAAFKAAMSSIATAKSKGVLHGNTASRYISRLNKQINRLSAK
jgi:small subunit ribosomal protein S20